MNREVISNERWSVGEPGKEREQHQEQEQDQDQDQEQEFGTDLLLTLIGLKD